MNLNKYLKSSGEKHLYDDRNFRNTCPLHKDQIEIFFRSWVLLWKDTRKQRLESSQPMRVSQRKVGELQILLISDMVVVHNRNLSTDSVSD